MSVLVAGFTGLAGSAIYSHLSKKSLDVIGANSKDVDFTDRSATFEYIGAIRPSIVIDCAALSGGIADNNSRPVDYLSKNLQIQTNLMDASHKFDVERFIFLGSSCIYPKFSPQPIREEFLMTGALEETNKAYAIAKIAGLELINSYRKQYSKKWISLMPTNLYGPFDNFDLKTGHVLAALINRFVVAARNNLSSLTLWGSGVARREFLYTTDLASAVEILLDKYDSDKPINVGVGKDISIFELANKIADFSGFKGEIQWDSTMPDGTPQKLLDVSTLTQMGWQPKVSLDEGIMATIRWFEANHG